MQTNHEIPREELLYLAKEAAEIGAEIARKERRNMTVSVEFKDSRNLVTNADIASQGAIIELIRSRYPSHRILAEESARTEAPDSYNKGYCWVIDPIDGTTNYAHGHFNVGVSVGCVLNGEGIAGAVAAPFLGEIFTAVKGGGAFLNGTPIRVKPTTKVADAVITTGFPYDRSNSSNTCKRIERVVRVCRDLRRLGAASLDLCWVACGRLDGYYEECIQPWDAAAGSLILREAGGVLAHFNYDCELQRMNDQFKGDLYSDNLVACTPGIKDELLRLLNGE
jgi:myo-inositol-1(or 4)-monophosphatase